ncbi:unnamed protein product, partial [Vitis vinifera]|uniref:Uncharacterized protein n=1 Tax=Vitis vinifera TaxID=29760 RepID=D7TG56_VITVI
MGWRSSYTEGEFWRFLAFIFWPEKKETESGRSILREEKFSSSFRDCMTNSGGFSSFIFRGCRKRKKQRAEDRS